MEIMSCIEPHAATAHIILLILLHQAVQTTILAGNRHHEDEENPRNYHSSIFYKEIVSLCHAAISSPQDHENCRN